jgi:hypothetical protein
MFSDTASSTPLRLIHELFTMYVKFNTAVAKPLADRSEMMDEVMDTSEISIANTMFLGTASSVAQSFTYHVFIMCEMNLETGSTLTSVS